MSSNATVPPCEGSDSATNPRRTILLAEDDPGYLFPISSLLSEAGYRVIEVYDGGSLLKQADDADVLVVDVRLPTGGTYEGIRAARRIRETNSGQRKPVVFICELSEENCADVLEGFPGRYVWLQKPLSGELLLDAIDEAERRMASSDAAGGQD